MKMTKKDMKDLLKWQITLIKEVIKNTPKKEYNLVLKDYQAELKILRRKS